MDQPPGLKPPHQQPRRASTDRPLWLGFSAFRPRFSDFLDRLGHALPGQVAGHGGGAKSGLFSEGSVAVVELSGVIMDSKKTLRALERYEEDGDVKALVLR